MDLLARAREVVAAANAGDITPYLAEVCLYTGRQEFAGVDWAAELRRRRLAWSHRKLEVLDAMWKRNLAFVSYAWVEDDGAQPVTGTWVLSFDRDGRITHWTEA